MVAAPIFAKRKIRTPLVLEPFIVLLPGRRMISVPPMFSSIVGSWNRDGEWKKKLYRWEGSSSDAIRQFFMDTQESSMRQRAPETSKRQNVLINEIWRPTVSNYRKN